ncbi:serine/threonine protein kinase [Roseibium sp. Sym1]|uniref:serine/threonine protein kinase n=1 Tax=Roseibium sp. Sym1 TaxID=3016006 RepID=UPI0022B2E492|nr:serine/threonine-protein kinase [Roseibium sp. Sym1]
MKVFETGLRIGARLNGYYEIDAPIAQGGVGMVYRAHDLETLGPVAIKVLHPVFSSDPVFLKLFRREALILRDLRHDALTRSYVFAREPDLGVHYLAMEYIDGPSLAEKLNEGALRPDIAYELLRRLASGLDAAHQMGIVHRDISPDNILLPGGEVTKAKIIDFGIARSDAHGTTVIGSGFAGKELYASPEQIGLFDGQVTARTDVYSLGLVIAHALSGKRIDMGGTHVDLVEKRKKVPDLGQLDERFQALLSAMLQPDPNDRLQSMSDVMNWRLFERMPVQVSNQTGLEESLEATLISELSDKQGKSILHEQVLSSELDRLVHEMQRDKPDVVEPVKSVSNQQELNIPAEIGKSDFSLGGQKPREFGVVVESGLKERNDYLAKKVIPNVVKVYFWNVWGATVLVVMSIMLAALVYFEWVSPWKGGTFGPFGTNRSANSFIYKIQNSESGASVRDLSLIEKDGKFFIRGSFFDDQDFWDVCEDLKFSYRNVECRIYK